MRLSRQEEKLRQELVAEMREAEKLVRYRFRELLSKLEAAPEDLNEAIRLYNAVLAKAQVFSSALAETFRESFDEKSERWQEGEAGQSADSFIQEWEEFKTDALDEVFIVQPELEEEPCHAKALDSLPSESE